MQLRWYPIIALTLVLLSPTACDWRVGQPGLEVSRPSGEPGQNNQSEPSDPCDQMGKYIKQACAIARDLEKFSWGEFSNIGMVYPPKGLCSVGKIAIVEKNSVTGEAKERWVSAVERLPSPQTAKTYSIQCNNCLKLAEEACSRSPYNEPKTLVQKTEAVAQWQELCGQLQSALAEAEHLVLKNKTIAAELTFPGLLINFTSSDEQIKRKYFNQFMTKSDKYIRSHGELIHNIQQAEIIAAELADWGFNSPNSGEQ